MTNICEIMSHVSDHYTALREDRDDTKPWILEWLIEAEDAPHALDLHAKLNIALEVMDLTHDLRESDWCIAAVEDENWLEKSYRAFQPFSIGQFFVYGSHYDDELPPAQLSLQIDAATAFGSGEHGTTKGCLVAMQDLKAAGVCPWNVLDMGTGSGILAIAAWKLWKTPIMAVDNDAESIAVTRRHMQANSVKEDAHSIICAVNEGFDGAGENGEKLHKRGPFELIIANILAGPLKDMAADMVAALDENGYIILSGILNEQAKDVQAVYEAQNMSLKKTYDYAGWSTLVLNKN